MPGEVPAALTAGLAAIADAVAAAEQHAASDGPAAAVAPLVEGLQAVRSLRSQLASRAITIPDDARFEIDSRLDRKEQQFIEAVLAAGGVQLEALADDGLVVAGQPVKVTVIAANRGASPMAVKQIGFRGLDGEAGVCKTGTVAAGGVYRCEAALEVSKQARLTGQYWKRLPDAARYQFEPDAPFGLPFRPTPFRVQFDLEIGGAPIPVERDVQYRYEGNIFSGEKRMELQVVPRLACHADARCRHPPGESGRGGGRAPGRARAARHRDQRQQGPCRGRRLARGAGRLERGAAVRGRLVHARRRGRAGPVHGDAPARREAGVLRREGASSPRARSVSRTGTRWWSIRTRGAGTSSPRPRPRSRSSTWRSPRA